MCGAEIRKSRYFYFARSLKLYHWKFAVTNEVKTLVKGTNNSLVFKICVIIVFGHEYIRFVRRWIEFTVAC